MQPRDVLKRMKSGTPPLIVDVRSGLEFRSGHIAGAVHVPLWKILLRRAPLPADKQAELVVTCEHGPRASLANGLLGLSGYRNVMLLDGHMAAWRQAGYPVIK